MAGCRAKRAKICPLGGKYLLYTVYFWLQSVEGKS